MIMFARGASATANAHDQGTSWWVGPNRRVGTTHPAGRFWSTAVSAPEQEIFRDACSNSQN